MTAIKNIEVSISKGGEVLFLSTTYNTTAFPHQHVGALMELVVEGFKLEEADHDCLNDLQVNGYCSFVFGNGVDWEYSVNARVTYPK